MDVKKDNFAKEKSTDQEKWVSSNTLLNTLISEQSSICLPSALWEVLLDSERKYLAFSMQKIGDSFEKINKSVKLSETESYIVKADVFMNDTLVEIPSVPKTIVNVQQLNNLLKTVDAVKLCKYCSADNKQNRCLIVQLPHMDVCQRCLHSSGIEDHNPNQDPDKIESLTLEKLRDITYCNNNTLCSLCHKKCSNEEQLSAHYKSHLSKNGDGHFDCTVCLKAFNNIKLLLEHYECYHSSVKFIKCTICNKKYMNSLRLKRHVRNHTNYEAFSCDYCSKGFVSKQKLKNHACITSATKSTFYKHHICSTCHTNYATKHLLQQHQREHQTHVPLKCKICKKLFDTEDAATKHKICCSDKRLKYPCNICNRKFSCISQKLNHVKSVHPLFK